MSDTITPEVLSELESTRVDASAALERIQYAVVIDTHDGLVKAAALLDDVVKRKDSLDARLKMITKPMREAEGSVRSLFKPTITVLETMEEALKTAIGGARKAIEKRNEQLRLAAETGDGEAIQALAHGIQPTDAPPNVQFREAWKFEVLDPGAVPRELLSVDESAVRAAVKAGSREIPGIRIWRDWDVAALRK